MNAKLYPADHASRGLTSPEVVNWILASEFLLSNNQERICADDPKVKQATVRTVVFKTEISNDNSYGVGKLIAYYSS